MPKPAAILARSGHDGPVFVPNWKDALMRKHVAAAAVVAALMVAPSAALAAPGDNASDMGQAHGAFAATNGNFGWLGALGGTPGYHGGAVGQEPGATGYNNSSLAPGQN
jgi:hypothetical protein